MEIEIQPVTAERWEDLVDLFQRPGPRGGKQVTTGCWCMFWRLPGHEFDRNWNWRTGQSSGEGNRLALRSLVSEGRVPGLLAYVEGIPAGWVSVGPREEFYRLQHSRTLGPIDGEPVWSIVCFYIDRRYRKRGLGTALLKAAVSYAEERGAEIVEGYAVKPGDADPYTGFEAMFLETGFQVVRSGGRRSIVRRKVGH